MPKRYVIIDGYNFLYAAGMMPKHFSGESLARSRKRLFRLLENRLSDAERKRTSIVFDVRKNRKLVPAFESSAGMSIHNAVNHPDADTLIEELIGNHSAPKQLLVVSSDHRLHRAARARKARAVDSDQFYDQLRERTRPRPAETKPSGPLEPLPPLFTNLPESLPTAITDEVAHWEKRIRELDYE